MVDYFFPPIAGSGAHRSAAYVKYLEEFGWLPVVLTVEAGDSHFHDPALLSNIPPHAEIHRTRSIEPVRFARKLMAIIEPRQFMDTVSFPQDGSRRSAEWLKEFERRVMFPDRHIGWLPFALTKAIRLCRTREISAVYSTSTVKTSHLVAYLVKRIFNKPWLADLQDPWTPPFGQCSSRVQEMGARRLERLIVDGADRLTVTTHPFREALLRDYPHLSPEKVTVLPLGFDPESFKAVPIVWPEKFTIVHFGNFYRERSPGPFLEALGQSIREAPSLASHVGVLFLGGFDDFTGEVTRGFVRRHNLQDVVHLRGFVPYRVGLRHVLGADVLLLITGPGLWGEKLLPAKIFDYLASRRPILVLAPEGPASQMVRDTRAGLIVDPEDVSSIKSAILDLYGRWLTGKLESSQPDAARLGQYHWRSLARSFASILESMR